MRNRLLGEKDQGRLLRSISGQHTHTYTHTSSHAQTHTHTVFASVHMCANIHIHPKICKHESKSLKRKCVGLYILIWWSVLFVTVSNLKFFIYTVRSTQIHVWKALGNTHKQQQHQVSHAGSNLLCRCLGISRHGLAPVNTLVCELFMVEMVK